ncbi:MAG: DUF3473 domain-containing protein [Candidatus Schekmanbacteria bacterium]|nr:DUF3473 domain-containing protein [Candidatus Schekmanbacteria bacterium]
MQNALSIDVEDYFHAEALAQIIPRQKWPECSSRVVSSTNTILNLLDKHRVKATFFILGILAEQFPNLVVDIASRGHEIGSHGYEHLRITQQNPGDFRSRLGKSQQILENILQEPVIGYRAPTFSITRNSLWALDILYEMGFLYDSSIFPIHHDRYGIPDAPRFPYRVWEKRNFYEFPASTLRMCGINWPVGGGGYLRILPFSYTKYGVTKLNQASHPAMVYLHPWEVDDLQPRSGLTGLSKFRHYYHLDKMLDRLQKLLLTFPFAPIREVLKFYNYEKNLFNPPSSRTSRR